jgi:hypothetical protein
MVEADDFVSGSTIRWRELGLAFIGSVILAITGATSGAILWIGESIIRIWDALSSTIGELFGMRYPGILISALDAATEQWAQSAELFGPAAFPVGLMMTAAMIAVMAWVVRYAI